MDFDKLLSQRQTKATVTENQETDAMLEAAVRRVMEQSKPGPKRKATSKRNDPNWRAQTFYLQEGTKAAIDRFLAMTKLDSDPKANHPADQSELIDAAITEWINRRSERLEAKVKAS